jgi:hypothetical protein
MGASSAGAETAPFLRLPEAASKEQRSLLRLKNVLTGTTGGVSSQCPPILPPNRRQGRPLD